MSELVPEREQNAMTSKYLRVWQQEMSTKDKEWLPTSAFGIEHVLNPESPNTPETQLCMQKVYWNMLSGKHSEG